MKILRNKIYFLRLICFHLDTLTNMRHRPPENTINIVDTVVEAHSNCDCKDCMCVWDSCAATAVRTLLGRKRSQTAQSLVLYQHLHLAHQIPGQGQNLLDVVVLSHFWKPNTCPSSILLTSTNRPTTMSVTSEYCGTCSLTCLFNN